MRYSMCTIILLLILATVMTGLALAEEGAPALTVDGPADGDWFIDPAVTVEGTIGTTSLTETLNMTVLGIASGDNVVLENGKLVYKVSPYFVDEFTGNKLDTSMWTVLGSTDHLSVGNGSLVVGTGGINPMPLVHSNAGMFPTDMDVPWIAEWRFKYSTAGTFFNVAGGGITPSSFTATGSHMATWKEHFEQGYYVYVNGVKVRTFTSETTDWNTYALHYDPSTGKYSAYLDGAFIQDFTRGQAPTRFWFGCPQYGTNTIYPSVTVDYARLWTFEADWESQVVDMGGPVVVEGARYDWTTNAAGKGTINVQMAASDDDANWTAWTDINKGRTRSLVEGRYLKFRADMAIPFVKDPSKRVSLSSITLDHHHKLVSLEYDHNDAGWTPVEVNDTWSFDLTLAEGTNHIAVRVTDNLGLTNMTAIELVLDTTAPTGSVEIDGGAELTSTLEVSLALTAEDAYGVPTMHISFVPNFKPMRTFDFTETMDLTLEGIDGPITVYVRFVDSHGLVSAVVSDTISLDMTAPEGTVQIDAGAEHASTDQVTLTLDHSDVNGVASVEVANDESITDAVTIATDVKELEWDLAVEADGTAWVYVRLTDILGNSIVISDSIEVYILKAEGTVAVDGDALTNLPTVTLTIDAPTHLRAELMQVSEDPTFEGVEWRQMAGTMNWILSPGDGTKTIYVRFEDFRGFHSLPVSTVVTVDTTSPVVTATIDGGAEYATDTLVTLTLTFDDDLAATDAWVGISDDRMEADMFSYADTMEWTLSAIEGEHTVHVWVADGAGNIGVATASIILATTAPTVTASVPGATNADTLPVDVEVTDALGGARVQVAIDVDPDGGDAWMAPTDINVDISGLTEGEHTVHVRARNAAGLLSDVVTETFTVDRTDPDLTILAPGDGVRISPEKLALEVGDTDGTVEYSVDGGEWTTLTGTEADLDLKKGKHTVDVRVTDEAGNVATSSTTFTIEEEESPGPTVVLTLAALVIGLVLVDRRRRQ